MSFETWTVLKQKMLNDLAAGNALYASYTDPSINRVEFTSLDDWWRFFRRVEQRADKEAGIGGPCILTGRLKR